MPVVIGVDSSTQSVKAEARELETGEVVATGFARHPATAPPLSEQDPRSWWSALVEAIGALGDVRDHSVAISVAAQQHGCVVLGPDGAPLRPAKLWNDTTSAPQAARLVSALGADAWAEGVGSVPVASFTITKLAWLAENDPPVLDNLARVMLPHDYLTWRLTGNHVTDRGDASGTGWYSPRDGSYELALLEQATGRSIDYWAERLPSVLEPSELAGELGVEAASALGLPAGIKVGPGTGDNMAAALGLGLEVGDVAVSLGTSGTVYAASSTPTTDPTGLVAGFADATGGFLPLVATLNATKVTDTVARWLGTDAPGLANLALKAESGGAVLVPYFDGERTPNLPTATGSFFGLSNDTSREQIALAAHDGVLCGLLAGLDALAEAGATVDGKVHLVGGGSRSGAYRQRCADLLGRPVLVPDTDETVATGAAVQSAVVVGDIGSFGEVAEAWGLGAGTRVEPADDASPVRSLYESVTSDDWFLERGACVE